MKPKSDGRKQSIGSKEVSLLVETRLVMDDPNADALRLLQCSVAFWRMRSGLELPFEQRLLEQRSHQMAKRAADLIAEKLPPGPKKKWRYGAKGILPAISMPPEKEKLEVLIQKPPTAPVPLSIRPTAPLLLPKDPPKPPPRTFDCPQPEHPPALGKSHNNFSTALDEFKASLKWAGKDYHGFQPPPKKPYDDTKGRQQTPYPPAPKVPDIVKITTEVSQNPKKRAFQGPRWESEDGPEAEPLPPNPMEDWARKEGLDPALIQVIESDILDKAPPVLLEDIAGLDDVKKAINETIIFPYMRPEFFTGLRKPSKGILLFGPPGTGKTMIGRMIASQLNCTFFSISSSSLISKWVGESEKLIKTLFRFALYKKPSVIFVDEIDSMLSVRGDSDVESVRRVKTEFFVQIDGAKSGDDEGVLIIGTTNRPEQIDEAARRRFTKRLYVPLPDSKARMDLFQKLIRKEAESGSPIQIDDIEVRELVLKSQGYSGADISNVMSEAAMGPIRELTMRLGTNSFADWKKSDMRPVSYQDVLEALAVIKASVAPAEIKRYVEWNEQFGTSRIKYADN